MLKQYSVLEALPAADLNQLVKAAGIVFDKVAGEAIDGTTLPVPILQGGGANAFVKDAAYIVGNQQSNQYGGIYYQRYETQNFTVGARDFSLETLYLQFYCQGAEAGATTTAKIYAIDGNNKPTGSALAISEAVYNSTFATGANKWVKFNFSPVKLSANTKYAIKVSSTTQSYQFCWVYEYTGAYTGGESFYSADDITWYAHDRDFNFITVGSYPLDDGKIYKSDANELARLSFLGFAISAADVNQAITIQTEGILGGFSDLIINREYFVQDTVGTIGLLQGTYGMRVGRAISATELSIEKKLTKTKTPIPLSVTGYNIIPVNGFIDIGAVSADNDYACVGLSVNFSDVVGVKSDNNSVAGDTRTIRSLQPVNAGDIYSVIIVGSGTTFADLIPLI